MSGNAAILNGSPPYAHFFNWVVCLPGVELLFLNEKVFILDSISNSKLLSERCLVFHLSNLIALLLIAVAD